MSTEFSNDLSFKLSASEEFDTIKKFYYDLIDMTQGDASFPMWKKGVHPSDSFIRESLQNKELFSVYENDRLIACVVCNNKTADGYDTVNWHITASPAEFLVLHVFAVDPTLHGKHIGRFLFNNIISLAKKRQIKTLRIDVIANNHKAEGFYKALGFQFVCQKTLYYDVVGEMSFNLYDLVL